MAEKQVMLVGVDDSEHSFYALQWALDHFFHSPSASPFKLVAVHAKSIPISAVALGGPGAVDILPLVEKDLKGTAERVTEKIKEACKKKGVDVEVDVIDGDARKVMCEAVEKRHASVLVLGSHGYGVFKRAVLGSVSDYCSHHAHCSVMIVKKPPAKH